MTGTIAILIVVFGGYSTTSPVPVAVYQTMDACKQDAQPIKEQQGVTTVVCIPLTNYFATLPALGAYSRN